MSAIRTPVINPDWDCPITRSIMLDPVEAQPCKHCFDRIAITHWMKTRPTPICPFDQTQITELKPKEDLKRSIHTFISKNPSLFENKTVEQLKSDQDESYAAMPISNVPELGPQLPINEDPLIRLLRERAAEIQVRDVEAIFPARRGGRVMAREYTGPPINEFFRTPNGCHCILQMSNDGLNMNIILTQDHQNILLKLAVTSAYVLAAAAAVAVAFVSITAFYLINQKAS